MERKDSQVQFRIPSELKKEWDMILKKRAQNKSALLIRWIIDDIATFNNNKEKEDIGR